MPHGTLELTAFAALATSLTLTGCILNEPTISATPDMPAPAAPDMSVDMSSCPVTAQPDLASLPLAAASECESAQLVCGLLEDECGVAIARCDTCAVEDGACDYATGSCSTACTTEFGSAAYIEACGGAVAACEQSAEAVDPCTGEGVQVECRCGEEARCEAEVCVPLDQGDCPEQAELDTWCEQSACDVIQSAGCEQREYTCADACQGGSCDRPRLCLAPSPTPESLTERDHYGASVAIGDGWAAIGAPFRSSGQVFLYKQRPNGTWGLTQTLTTDDITGGAGQMVRNFGFALDLSGDALVISAPNRIDAMINDPTPSTKEKLYVFAHDGVTWTHDGAPLENPNSAEREGFGFSVELHGDHLITGAPFAGERGAAWIYKRQSNTWSAPGLCPAPSELRAFGWDVSILRDGTAALVGAPETNANAGAVGACQPIPDSTNWQVTAMTQPDGGDKARFGASVSVDNAGAAVGAPLTSVMSGASRFAEAGAVYFYKLEGTNPIRLEAQPAPFVASAPGERLGAEVKLRGATLVASAPFSQVEATNGAGVVFWRANTGKVRELTAAPTSGGANFGASLDLHEGSGIIGAPNANGLRGEVRFISAP